MEKRELTQIWISAARRIAGGAVGGGNVGLHTGREWSRPGLLASGRFIQQVVDVRRTQGGNARRNTRHPRMIDRAKNDQICVGTEGIKALLGYPHWEARYPPANTVPAPVNERGAAQVGVWAKRLRRNPRLALLVPCVP